MANNQDNHDNPGTRIPVLGSGEPPTSSTISGVFTAILKDPLSEVTRKERLYLLAVSIIAIAIVRTGLVPTKITTLGIEFDGANQKRLLFVVGLVTIYFLAAFIIYAVADLYAWMEAYQSAMAQGGAWIFKGLENLLNKEAAHKLRFKLSQNIEERQAATEVVEELYKEQIEGTEVGQRARQLGVVHVEVRHSAKDPRHPSISWEIGERRGPKTTRRMALIIAAVRAAFEYLLPVLVGVYALYLLIFVPESAITADETAFIYKSYLDALDLEAARLAGTPSE